MRFSCTVVENIFIGHIVLLSFQDTGDSCTAPIGGTCSRVQVSEAEAEPDAHSRMGVTNCVVRNLLSQTAPLAPEAGSTAAAAAAVQS